MRKQFGVSTGGSGGVARALLRTVLVCCAMVLPILVAGEGSAEIEIVLKDGKVYRLPVPGADIDSILLDGERVYPGPKVGQAESGPEQERPAAAAPQPAIGRIVQVGPGRLFRTPRQAMRNVRDGDTIEIDAGSYPGDVAVWTANNITLRGVGGFAHRSGSLDWVFR